MYQLYFSPGSCAMAIHVLLNELKQPVELKEVSIQKGETRTPEYLKLNPMGAVPVLVEDGKPYSEGAAIILHLLEKHNSPMLPKSGEARDKAIYWLMFANATMHPNYSKLFFINKAVTDDAQKQALFDKAAESINNAWKYVDSVLAKNEYVCGKEITAADILLTVIANWSANFPQVVLPANCKRLFKQISSRPAYQDALSKENVQYKVAA